MWLSESEWFKPGLAMELGPRPMVHFYSHPRELPGMGNLVQLVHKAGHCKLEGNDGRIAQYIRSELDRLKGERTSGV